MKKMLTPIVFIISIYGISYFFKSDITNFYIKYLSKQNTTEMVSTELNSLKNENEYLKNLIKNSTSSNTFSESGIVDLIPASPSFLDRSSIIYNNIILNKGSEAGVKNDALVYVSGLRPVGIIKNTNLEYSTLELFTNYKKDIEVFVNSKSVSDTSTNISISTATVTNSIVGGNIYFNIIGDGSYGFSSKLLKSISVKVGEDVYIKNYPSLKIGKIIEIEDIKNENEKIVYIKSNFTRNSENLFYIEN